MSWALGIAFAIAFALLLIPTITAERWLGVAARIEVDHPAPLTVRVPLFAGYDTDFGRISGGGVRIVRGEIADRDAALDARDIDRAQPHGATPLLAYLLLVGVLGALFTYHMRRSLYGRLVRVQLVSLALIVLTAIVVQAAMLLTGVSVLVVPIALFALVPTLVLDRIVGLATGMLAALVISFVVPFDYGIAILLLVQAAAAGLVVAERPKRRLRSLLVAGTTATVFTAATYPLMVYLSVGRLPLGELRDPLHSAWFAAALGPAIATGLAIVFVPIYQLLVGEIPKHKLIELEDLSHPLLKQISERAPGTWQHSLTMANMAECAANVIGADGRLVRVGAYFHDLGKSLNPKYFIENLEPGETSPHDKLPPEVSCDAIFRHVTEGIVTARRAGLHERIIDFMHMHHGNGVLEYFWAKCVEQGNPKHLTVEHFRYPGVPPQSRETAILSICDAVEAAARTLKKPDVGAIDNLVQRIVYGKLHLGQLDESGLSMGDLRRVTESLRDTIRHANHGRIEYPWQKAQQDASAVDHAKLAQTSPRLDSLDRQPRPESVMRGSPAESDSGATPNLRHRDSGELATRTTAPVGKPDLPPGASAARTRDKVSTPRDAAVAQAWAADAADEGKDLSSEIPLQDVTVPAPKLALPLEIPPPKYPLEPTARVPKTTLEIEDDDVIIELRDSKSNMITPAQLAERLPPELPPAESSARLRRVTDPIDERKESAEARQFAIEAKAALDEAHRDLLGVPLESVEETSAAVKKRAAALPAITPTQPPPLGRRAPTVPPPAKLPTVPPPAKPPTVPPVVTAPPPTALRPPGPAQVALPGMTAPPPGVVRQPGINYLEDMITLKPQYELKDDAAATQPRMQPAQDDDTNPSLELSDGAPLEKRSSWARGLAARLDEKLEQDFGTDTPVSAPTRAELQALMEAPLDATRQQSIEEIERLHQATRDRRPSEEELLAGRRPHPTREIEDSDIEAAIELAPPARKGAIGVAKKKPPE